MQRELTLDAGSYQPQADDKHNLSSSKLCTQLTSNFDSNFTGLLNENRNDPELKQRQTFISKRIDEAIAPIIQAQANSSDLFEDSIYSKLNQLQMRSSRVINMFPQFHSKHFQSSLGLQVCGVDTEDPQMANKIKIIKDLQNKIYELEVSVKNPLTCQQYMKSIQHQIRRNFDNYYLEGKQILPSAENNQSHHIQQPISPTLISAFSKKNSNQDHVVICVPKIIEIEVPLPVFKTVEASKASIRRSRSEGQLNSSIGHIIDKFDKKFCQNNQKVYTYQQNEPQIIVNAHETFESGSGLHLPLDSFQNIQGQFKGGLLKRTDRSNISSTSELQKIRQDTWNKNFIELNHQYLSQVQQMQQKSQSNDDESRELMLESRNGRQQSVSQRVLEEEVQNLKKQVEAKKIQLDQIIEQNKQFESKAIEKQIQLLEQMEKYEEIEQQNNTLKEREQYYHGEVVKAEQTEVSLKQRVNALEKQLLTVIEEKQFQIIQYQKTIQQKNQEIYEGLRINQQLKNLISKKQTTFQTQIQEAQSQILSLKEEIKYYKMKVEQQGFHLDLEEASRIRELIENKDQLVQVSSKYIETVKSLKKQGQKSQKCIEELQNENKKLQRKSTEIKQQQEAAQRQIKQILAHINIEQTQKQKQKDVEEQHSQNVNKQVQSFQFLVNRVSKLIKYCNITLGRQKQEKQKISNKLKGLNLYVNRQIQKVEQRSVKLQKENTRYKRQAQDLSSEVRKLQIKLKHVKSRLIDNPMSSIHQIQNELLELQNKKLLQKCKKSQLYTQQLEQKLVSQLKVDGTMQQKIFRLIQRNKQQEKKDKQQNLTQFQLIKARLREQMSHSEISNTDFNHSLSQPPKNIHLASKVLTFINRPSKAHPKSILAPLPSIIPAIKQASTSLTLQKLLIRKNFWTSDLKTSFIIKLFNLCIELIKVTRKLFSLKPSQMVVSIQDNKVDIVIRRQFSEGKEQDDANLLYRAPEVLLGFSESEASYVWSVGVIIDQLLHGSLFYKKINQILSRKQNYEVRQPTLSANDLLKQMMKKNQKTRYTMEQAKTAFLCLKC